ncbi:MAG: phosphatidylserine decarboxylase family protein [Saprospiraceae bacterium]
MFRLHREGYSIIIGYGVMAVVLGLLFWFFLPRFLALLLLAGLVVLGVLVVQFFRDPARALPRVDDKLIYAPADGKVCAIEEVDEPEYFQGRRLLVSIFMSPLNVHVNRNPVSGTVAYYQYHSGRYLTAWHPKSSTENERSTVVYKTPHGEVLMRQVAGAVARRICSYVKTGDPVVQGEEMGFIKFGSRVDLYLPLDIQLTAKLDDDVRGKLDVVARFY